MVLSGRHQQAAQRGIAGHLVLWNLDSRGRERDGLDHRANAVHGIHGQQVGCGDVNVTRRYGERLDRVTVSDEVTVFGRRLDWVHRHLGKFWVIRRRNAPLAVVVKTTRASQVSQGHLILVAVNQRLGDGAANLAKFHGRANVGHGIAQVNGETHLIDTNAGVVQVDANALALGNFVTHDGVRIDRLHEMKFHFVALAASQVLAAHDGHIGSGLLAQALGYASLAAWHLTGHAVEHAVSLHGLKEKASGLYVLRIGRARAYCRLGHCCPPSKGWRAASS